MEPDLLDDIQNFLDDHSDVDEDMPNKAKRLLDQLVIEREQ